MFPIKRIFAMLKYRFGGYFLIIMLSITFLYAVEPKNENSLPPPFGKLLPLHKSLGKPEMGDWLAEHREDGQTYRQYLDGKPIIALKYRRTIYIQPLGDLTKTQKKIIDLTAEYMADYFMLPVKILQPKSLSEIPDKARRKREDLGEEQILSTYILNDVLKPRLPKDAVTLIAITPVDLWPGEGWNFVFGQASLRDRVGVWSFQRFGNPEASDNDYLLCLKRTIKVATHETGHMFSMQHCIQFECNMNGSNSLQESDRRPLEVCPHCLAKLCHATRADPVARFKKLIYFCKSQGLKNEQEFYELSMKKLR
jgi:archaemetzincin